MHLPTLLSYSSLQPPNHTPRPRSAVLGSSSWSSRLALLATLGERDPASAALRSSHSVDISTAGHTGCVNTLSWEDGGEGRLISAGDDTKICIWRPSIGAPSSASPTISYELESSIATGHRANIFSVRFAPGMSERIISAAGDRQVRIFDLAHSSDAESVSSGPRKWTHHGADACVRVLRCHSGRVKRIALEDSADVFLTCAEDGEVRQHDLRTGHTCGSESNGCEPPLLKYPGLSLYSLSASKLRPHLFAVAGTSPYTFLHDRRMLRAPLFRDWGVALDDDGAKLTQCVRRFGVPDSADPRKMSQNHVVATKMSESCARDLIVSYSGDAVYLFDTDAEAYTPPARQRHRRRSDDGAKTGGEKRRRKGRSSSVGAGSDSEMDEERPQVASAPEDDDDTGPPPPLEALAAVEHLLSTGEPTPTSSDVTIETDDVHTDTESSSSSRSTSPLRPSVRRTEYELDAPLVGPVRLFSGHANEETVKDVNFAFAGSTVVSGSDDGNWFAWDKESGELKGIYQGDESVVNVLQPHPRLPIVAISGIDSTIKIFGPTASTASSSNLIAEAPAIMRRNESRHNESGYTTLSEADGRAFFNLLAGRVAPGGAGIRLDVDGRMVRVPIGDRGECVVM